MAHEAHGAVREVAGKAQALQQPARHLGANDLMTVEVRPVLGPRLSEVVQQRRRP